MASHRFPSYGCKEAIPDYEKIMFLESRKQSKVSTSVAATIFQEMFQGHMQVFL
jgi:hypothetical protein